MVKYSLQFPEKQFYISGPCIGMWFLYWYVAPVMVCGSCIGMMKMKEFFFQELRRAGFYLTLLSVQFSNLIFHSFGAGSGGG